MIYYFIRGFLYPIETNFWLVHYGFPIIMMEFFSFFAIMMIPEIIATKKIKTIFALLIVILFAFAISFIFYSYWVFLFFILTILSKFFVVYTVEDYENETKLYVTMMIAFILSAFLALVFSVFGNAFPIQQELLRNRIIETATRLKGSSIKGEIVDNPAYIVAWGVIYYIMLTLFQTFNLIKFQKKNTEPDSDDMLEELAKIRPK